MAEKTNLQQRTGLFIDAVKSLKPYRVPVLLQAETFQIAYGGYTTQECIADLNVEIECCKKTFEDIYCDGATMFGFNRPEKIYGIIGESSYFVSSDGATLQHEEKAPMPFSDYPALIADAKSYIINKYFSDRYSLFNLPYEEKKAKLTEVAAAFFEGLGNGKKKNEFIAEKFGIPIIFGPMDLAPLDILFDFLRGFKNTLTDIRRSPQTVKEAAEAIYSISNEIANPGPFPAEEFPFLFNPLHIPTFLGPKQFGELYWPTYFKIISKYLERGGKIHIFLEGNWEHFYDFLDEIPSGGVQCSLEDDEPLAFKKRFGGKLALSGGITLGLLKYASTDECIDRAKWCLDNLAPNGGYIFSTDKALLSKDDVRVENLIAVNEYIRDCGKY